MFDRPSVLAGARAKRASDDLNMLAVVSGRERFLSEYDTLIITRGDVSHLRHRGEPLAGEHHRSS